MAGEGDEKPLCAAIAGNVTAPQGFAWLVPAVPAFLRHSRG
jgi:hypothetical protein